MKYLKILSFFSLLTVWSLSLYCFGIAHMYNSLGEFDHISTLNPLGATSVLHITQAYIKGYDFENRDILIKYPMLSLLDFKSQDELKKWIAESLSKPISVYVNKDSIAYITQQPEHPILNMIPWLLIGIYLFIYGTYSVYKIYNRFNIKNNYTQIRNVNM